MATITDVARLAGVSTATVSRVLNGRVTVDPDMAARVQQVVADLEYRPSGAARALRTRRTRVWSLVLSDIRNPFFTEFVRGVEDLAYEEEYSLVLCNSGEDPARERAYLRLALAEQVAGIILIPARTYAAESAEIGRARKLGVPLVMADRRAAPVALDHVLIDNVVGADEAVRHLLSTGHRRIACITGPTSTSTGEERLRGYREALERAGASTERSFVRVSDFKEQGGYNEMAALLARRRLPDAVFVANNMMTIGALRAIADAGLSIPEDIAVVGFDDMSWAPLLKPPLSAVAQPAYEMGAECARILLSRIDSDGGAYREILLRPHLVVRASSGPSPRARS